MQISKLLSNHHDGREVYRPVYDEFFTDGFCGSVQSILEIGIQYGYGLRAWLDCFPDASIYGLDIMDVTNQLKVEFSAKDRRRLSMQVCDSTDAAAVKRLLGSTTFDIIIDDGSHKIDEQLATLRNLLPRLSLIGIYVLEDVWSRQQDDPMVQIIQQMYPAYRVLARPVNPMSGVIVIQNGVTSC